MGVVPLMLRRPRVGWIATIVAVAALFGVSAALGENPSEQVLPVPQRADGPVLTSAARCAPIINGLAARSAQDGFLMAGFHDDWMPAELSSRFRVGSYTCLEDHLAQRVQGVVVSLVDPSGATVGYWVQLPQDDADRSAWRTYLSEIDGRISSFGETPSGLLGLRSDLRVDTQALVDGTSVSLWSELLSELIDLQ